MSTQRGETCHHNYSNSGGLIIITLFVKIVWVSYHFPVKVVAVIVMIIQGMMKKLITRLPPQKCFPLYWREAILK